MPPFPTNSWRKWSVRTPGASRASPASTRWHRTPARSSTAPWNSAWWASASRRARRASIPPTPTPCASTRASTSSACRSSSAVPARSSRRANPGMRIVIGELGWPWIDECLAMLLKHPNVFAEISGVAGRPWQLYNTLLSAQSMGVMEKLFFGSGFPYELPAKAIENLYSVNAFAHGTQLPSIPRTALRAIAERDPFAVLGIDSPAARAVRQRPASAEGDLSRDLR
ncbi:MAG: hypothetical protein EBU31_11790 [Proteobacteria bacterium]|nr:hypothetical protein [Pseudomonadota bacterium]